MNKSHNSQPASTLSRRSFLRNTIGGSLPIAVSGSLIASNTGSAAGTTKGMPELPRRKLGRNGPEVTVVAQGGSMSAHSAMFLELAWAHGIRYFDASESYINGQCELNIRDFLARDKSRRKDLFLVTKSHPKSPSKLLTDIDDRLAALKTDYLDLYFIHGIGTRGYGQESLEWPKSDELKEVASKLKASGKVKMVGFSCHDNYLLEYMNAAAEGGFLDVIMVAYEPFHEKGGGFDKALTACHDAGIGLVAMKNFRSIGEVSKRIPGLDAMGLTTYEALVHTVMADKRISSFCIESANTEQLKENTGAAINFDEKKSLAAINVLRDHVAMANHPVCPGCDSCRTLGKTDNNALTDIARYVTYYEKDGKMEARDYYRELSSSELEYSASMAQAARESCSYSVDYPRIMNKAKQYFA